MSLLLLENAALVGGMMLCLWLCSLWRRDVSIVDPFWSVGFLLVALSSARHGGPGPARWLLVGLVALWSLRLCLHLLVRGHGRPEDPRYAAFRARYGPERYPWISLFQVFGLQGALILLISAPLVASGLSPGPAPIGPIDTLGAVVALAGILCELVADEQLRRYKADPQRGPVMDRGLWAWSRHPNYFGEALLWWGFWLSAADDSGGLWTLPAPLLMTWLLLRVSGVPMLEQQLKARSPAYAAYIERTSAFLPLPPRAPAATSKSP